MYSLCDWNLLWVSWRIWLSLNAIFINSWPRNPPPWSLMIPTGHGYRTSHVVSTKFATVIAFLLLCCVTSKCPVTGFIIVTAFNIRGIFSFLLILWGIMRSTHSLFHGVSSASLAGDLPYFFCWPFRTLTRVTSRGFLLDGFSNAWPVKMLANHRFRSIW